MPTKEKESFPIQGTTLYRVYVILIEGGMTFGNVAYSPFSILALRAARASFSPREVVAAWF